MCFIYFEREESICLGKLYIEKAHIFFSKWEQKEFSFTKVCMCIFHNKVVFISFYRKVCIITLLNIFYNIFVIEKSTSYHKLKAVPSFLVYLQSMFNKIFYDYCLYLFGTEIDQKIIQFSPIFITLKIIIQCNQNYVK